MQAVLRMKVFKPDGRLIENLSSCFHRYFGTFLCQIVIHRSTKDQLHYQVVRLQMYASSSCMQNLSNKLLRSQFYKKHEVTPIKSQFHSFILHFSCYIRSLQSLILSYFRDEISDYTLLIKAELPSMNNCNGTALCTATAKRRLLNVLRK